MFLQADALKLDCIDHCTYDPRSPQINYNHQGNMAGTYFGEILYYGSVLPASAIAATQQYLVEKWGSAVQTDLRLPPFPPSPPPAPPPLSPEAQGLMAGLSVPPMFWLDASDINTLYQASRVEQGVSMGYLQCSDPNICCSSLTCTPCPLDASDRSRHISNSPYSSDYFLQDTAGTVPVTKFGDTVSYWVDKSPGSPNSVITG